LVRRYAAVGERELVGAEPGMMEAGEQCALLFLLAVEEIFGNLDICASLWELSCILSSECSGARKGEIGQQDHAAGYWGWPYAHLVSLPNMDAE
jgi:hypothetical protein